MKLKKVAYPSFISHMWALLCTKEIILLSQRGGVARLRWKKTTEACTARWMKTTKTEENKI
jgi:hypothetical protein